jgi:hypothetical protein
MQISRCPAKSSRFGSGDERAYIIQIWQLAHKRFRSPFCQPRGYSAKSPKIRFDLAKPTRPTGDGLLSRSQEPCETFVARVLRARKVVLRSIRDTR